MQLVPWFSEGTVQQQALDHLDSVFLLLVMPITGLFIPLIHNKRYFLIG